MVLTCPPAPVRISAKVVLPNRPIANGLNVIGLELRIAFASIGQLIDATSDNSFWLSKSRELMLRPAVETLLLAHWEKLKSFELTEPQLANLCSMLCGGTRQQARTRDHYGLWDRGNVKFEPAEVAARWWDDIQGIANKAELAPLLPAYCFARTIIAHPYPDGNGRLARALVHAALARTADYAAPALPLAPAFYMNGTKVAHALRDLSDTGDWDVFNAVFAHVLNDAAKLARRVS